MKLRTYNAILLAAVSNFALAPTLHGQSTEIDASDDVVVVGVRAENESSANAKRKQTVVADALMGVDLGDLPDLSIAETLERITGVTADRFKGGASDVSIRGLGAFLGLSTLNGREISSGSDGRSVNFGQFPSELFNGALVYKSQQASLIEGGVSGQITLNTLRPLDYGRKRTQLLGLIGYSEGQSRVRSREPYNGRITASYVDQFETSVGDIGVAFGGQIRRDSSPEDVFVTSSAFPFCEVNTSGTNGNCNNFVESSNIDSIDDDDLFLVSNQYIFRALETDTDRDSAALNVQWQPGSDWDVNLDLQYSFRSDLEERHSLVFSEGRRNVRPIEIADDYGLLAFEGNSRIELQSNNRVRDETYIGGGLNVEWQKDRWKLSGDVGFSMSDREQDEHDARIRTQERVDYILDMRGVDVPSLTFTDVSAVEANTGETFDLNNIDIYTYTPRGSRRAENVDDDIFNARLDTAYVINGNVFSAVQAGARYYNRQRVRDDGLDTFYDAEDFNEGGDAINFAYLDDLSEQQQNAYYAAQNNVFPVKDLFSGANTSSEGLTWVTFDPLDLFVAYTGDENFGAIANQLSPEDTNIEEQTLAAYMQLDIDTMFKDTPVTGNVGVRAVHTDIESIGFVGRIDGDEAIGESIVSQNDFLNILPSFNLAFELDDTRMLRFSGYRALARPGIEDLSAGITIREDVEDDIGAIDEISIRSLSPTGNPFLEPLTSWNLDASYEWYKSRDTSFSIAGYYKLLETGLEVVPQEFQVPQGDEIVTAVLGRSVNSDDESNLFGVELTVQHAFTDLPEPFNGLGLRAGVNYVNTDFETPDPSFDFDVTDSDGYIALADYLEPVSIMGSSEWSGNAEVYWENEKVQLRLAYRGRSEFANRFRQSSNRIIAGQELVDFRSSYDLTDNIEVRFQVLNMFNEGRTSWRPVASSLTQYETNGRRLFLGARAKF